MLDQKTRQMHFIAFEDTTVRFQIYDQKLELGLGVIKNKSVIAVLYTAPCIYHVGHVLTKEGDIYSLKFIYS